MDLRPGAVIAGRYRVDRKVGAGGMGEVWSGDHLAIGSKVALKTMLPAAAVNHEVVARFKREAFLLGRIRSDYVARVVDFVADDNFGLVLVMEYIEGQSLARVLTERVLTVEETVELGCDLACALCDLHRAHIVHRDLKPGNVMLSRLSDGRSRAVIVDFGVSRLLSAGEQDEETITGITRADMAVGTIEYMSPEQILNSRSVTGASDIYAVGAMLYRALTGTHVFGDITGESELAQLKLTQEAPLIPVPRADRLSTALKAAVARALRRRPSERYRSAEEMVEAFTPLRDLVRLAALDLDSTTTQDARPSTPEATLVQTRESFASIPDGGAPIAAGYFGPTQAGMRGGAPQLAPPPAAPAAPAARAAQPSRRAPALFALVGLVVALGVGGIGAVLFLPQLTAKEQPSATPAAAPPPATSEGPAEAPSAAPATDDQDDNDEAEEVVDLDAPTAAPTVTAAASASASSAPVASAPSPALAGSRAPGPMPQPAMYPAGAPAISVRPPPPWQPMPTAAGVPAPSGVPPRAPGPGVGTPVF